MYGSSHPYISDVYGVHRRRLLFGCWATCWPVRKAMCYCTGRSAASAASVHTPRCWMSLTRSHWTRHYVPGLALEIVRANAKAADRNGVLDLQGFLVGNAWTDTAIDNEGAVDFWWAHALISDETNQGLKETCPLKQAGQSETANDCDDFIDAAMRELTGINIYEIYADLCLPESALAMVSAGHMSSNSAQDAGPHKMRRTVMPTQPCRCYAMKPAGALGLSARALTARYRTTRAGALESEEPEYDPCIDYEVGTYLNLPEVQK
eukprot:365629-Chlamydomonas_euryale.AAC.8